MCLPPALATDQTAKTMLWSRRQVGVRIAGAGAVLAMPVVRALAQARPEKKRVTIAVAGRNGFFALPLTIADQLDYFRGEGLDVEFSDMGNGAASFQALSAKAVDLVSGSFDEVLHWHNRGQPVQAFVLQGRAPQIAVGVSARNLPNLEMLQDLRGKRIGVSALGSPGHLVASVLLSRAGLKEADVMYVVVGGAAGAVTALRQGLVDAISHTDPVMTLLEQRAEIRLVADTRTLKGTFDLFGGPMPAACLYASSDFAAKYPQTAQALTHAVVRALKWLHSAGPGDIIKTVPETYLLGDRALYLASFNKVREGFSLDGMLPQESAMTALNALAMAEPGFKADRIDLDRTYTNEFARVAKNRFRV